MPRTFGLTPEEKEENMQKALAAIQAGSSINKASEDFNVPRSTLSERNSGVSKSGKRGTPRILTDDEEKRFVTVSPIKVLMILYYSPFKEFRINPLGFSRYFWGWVALVMFAHFQISINLLSFDFQKICEPHVKAHLNVSIVCNWDKHNIPGFQRISVESDKLCKTGVKIKLGYKKFYQLINSFTFGIVV